jgi:hypothetical protein
MPGRKLSDTDARELQDIIHAKGDYGHVAVRLARGHLQIEVEADDGSATPVARATGGGGGEFQLSFLSHTGRWEPLPMTGPPDVVAEMLTTALGAYLDKRNFA